ncbi:syntaxin-8 isoform X2 [Takifugu rubripes]|uniref:syntaxin-8 isoform X2 n=1 Tax=Takifugu rubripes TaxID=31033 RepID=UPI001145931B|nr:syntaxin-8 isoform X2 [Takifugu rubripes]
MSPDLWLQNYDATCRLAQEIAENIHERNKQLRTGGNPAKINMTLRASLQKLKQNIGQLKDGLLRASSSRRIMQAEADRWQSLIDDLVTRERHLNASFKGDVTESDPTRSALIAEGAGASRGVAANPWLVNETEETKGLTFGDIKEQQQRIIEAQDAGLDALAAVISRQKTMGQDIGNELDEQNEIIDDLAHLVDKTDNRIRNETRRVKLVETKSASCGFASGTHGMAITCCEETEEERKLPIRRTQRPTFTV